MFEKLKEKIIARYSRGENNIIHHGDCYIYSSYVCTCGLLSDLRRLSEGQETLYINYGKEEFFQQFAIEKAGSINSHQILSQLFNRLSEDDQSDCLVQIGLLNKPKKLSKSASADIIKLVKQYKKMHQLWNVVRQKDYASALKQLKDVFKSNDPEFNELLKEECFFNPFKQDE